VEDYAVNSPFGFMAPAVGNDGWGFLALGGRKMDWLRIATRTIAVFVITGYSLLVLGLLYMWVR
jgi:hypothetical protein